LVPVLQLLGPGYLLVQIPACTRVANRNASGTPSALRRLDRTDRHSVAGYRTTSKNMELRMNWDRIEGNWKQLTGKVKEKWGKLTDDDIAQINGNREQLEGKVQARYGYAKDQVKKDVDDWLGHM
jgi:uncharacterized protein YjbJ (UPF0337 family)